MTGMPTRAAGALYPIEFAKLPRSSRRLFKRLEALPTWQAEGWAHPSDEYLRDEGEYSDKRPIQRARRALVELGVVEYREIRKGGLLPNGDRARFRHWIYVAGPALRPHAAEPPHEEQCEKGTVTVPKEHRYGAILVPRSVDLERSEKVGPSAPSEPHPTPSPLVAVEEEQTSLRSEGSTDGSPPLPPPPAEIAPAVLAVEVLRYFVAATALGWKTIRNDVIEYVTPFLGEMNGDGPSKVARACRVIDAVIRECAENGRRKPTIRFVFHREIFWKRLDALANPKPQGPVRALGAHAKAFASADRPKVRSTAPRAPQPESVLLDVVAMLAHAFDDAERDASPPVVIRAGGHAAATSNRGSLTDEEFEELRRCDREARVRAGLAPARAA